MSDWSAYLEKQAIVGRALLGAGAGALAAGEGKRLRGAGLGAAGGIVGGTLAQKAMNPLLRPAALRMRAAQQHLRGLQATGQHDQAAQFARGVLKREALPIAGALGAVVGAPLAAGAAAGGVGGKYASAKTAGTPFLEQNRPSKVKEIYSALKRDHPDMPAEMKARIAARQGKRGKQKQGPPYEGPITSKYKAASLNQALGVLYDAYGPPKTKHAAANYFFYEANRGERDAEALGAPFCKLAHQSGLDPWDMAVGVVRQFPALEKAASRRGPGGDLARFYLDWADEVEKRANILARIANAPQAIANVAQRGAAAAKAGAGAARQGMMSQKQLATKGLLKGEAPSVGGAVRKSLAQTKHMQEVGGGSVSRGRGLIQRGEAAPLIHGPPPAAPRPTIRQAPPAAPTTAPAAESPTMKHYLLGGGLLAGAGLTGAGVYNAAQEPQPGFQPQYQGAY